MTGWVPRTLLAVALVSALAGLVVLAAPAAVMGLLAVERSPTADLLFTIAGLFIALLGGLFAHALRIGARGAFVLPWIVGEKAGAAAFVAWGASQSLFAPVAYALAAYDAAAGVLTWIHWRTLRRAAPHEP